MTDLSEQEAAALEQLRAPSGLDIVERVHAERLGSPAHLRAKDSAEAAANEIAALIAGENSRARAAEERADKAEDELRLAWAQVPMFEQSEMSPPKQTLKDRALRLGKR